MQEQVRVVAIHDGAGNISVLIASSADAEPAGVRLEHWEYTHEVEIPDLALDVDHAQIHARLDEVTENFRVEVEAGIVNGNIAQLVRKNDAQSR